MKLQKMKSGLFAREREKMCVKLYPSYQHPLSLKLFI